MGSGTRSHAKVQMISRTSTQQMGDLSFQTTCQLRTFQKPTRNLLSILLLVVVVCSVCLVGRWNVSGVICNQPTTTFQLNNAVQLQARKS